MDLSKLPRLSQTPPPPAGHNPDAPPEPAVSPSEARGFPVTPVGSMPPNAGALLYCRCGAQLAPGTRFCSNCGASFAEAMGDRPVGGGGGGAGGGMWMEAFVSIGIGLFLLLLAPTGIKYWTTTLRGGTFAPYLHPTDPGVYVDYQRFQDTQTGAITDYKYRDRFDHFWNDTAVTAFALALILEGIVLALVRNRWAVLAAAVLITAVTLLNLWYVVASYTRVSPITRATYGLAPYSLLAVIFGVVMAGYQFRLFKELSPRRRR